jgi:pimeloyl-ACP methyl ester carboxylesterase
MVDDNEAKLKKKLLVFVHGLGANGNEWWGLTKPSIENSPKLSEFDKLFFDYETSGGPSSIVKKIGASIGALDRSETVPQAAERLWSDILHMMQVNQYSDVYLLGHSMGGIVIASAIDHAFRSKDDRHPVLIDAIKKIALVASPISGAKLASKAAWLYRFLGPNEHINILRHESIVREDLVSEFVDHLLIGRKVPMHIFRAGNDSAVGQNELTEEIPEGIKFRFDVLKGGHSECIQDLKPWDRNFEKLLMWINPYKVDFDQVSPDEKPEIDQTGQIGIPALGPGERYLINEAPNGWTTQFQSMQEYMQGAFGIKGDLGVVDSAAGKEALVIRSIKASSIIPTPFVSQINGRPFPTALEIPLSAEFVVLPVPKAHPPVFFQRTIDENFARMIGSICNIGLFRMISQDSGELSKSKRVFKRAEFVQETKDVTFNGVPNQNVTIILQLFAVEGNFQDYTITIKSFEHQGDPGQEKELADMQTLFNSFTLLGTLDKDKTAMDAPKEADEKQEQFIKHNG